MPEKSDVSYYLQKGGSIDALNAAYECAVNLASTKANLEFPSEIFGLLPRTLHNLINAAQNDTDRSTLLLTTLVAIGSCLPNAGMFIDGTFYCPDLYLFVTGPVGSGKGIAKYAEIVVSQVHASRNAAYQQELTQHKVTIDAKRKSDVNSFDSIDAPKRKKLIVPGDSTMAVVAELIAGNDSTLIIETEADALASLLRSEYGDASPILRAAWHHESLKLARRRDNTFIVHERPRLAIVVCGTPLQVRTLLRFSENGLTSRFIFHVISAPSPLRNPFESTGSSLNVEANLCAKIIKHLHDDLSKLKKDGLQVKFTAEQQSILFADIQTAELLSEESDALQAANRRMAIVLGRLATTLTVLSAWELDNSSVANCAALAVSDQLFQIVLKLGAYLRSTMLEALKLIPEGEIEFTRGTLPQKMSWYETLSGEFSSRHALEVGSSLGISPRTVNRYLKEEVLFEKLARGTYAKRDRGTMAQ